MSSHYDFIVTGAGAAGRSFVHQLLRSSWRDKSVLLIDKLEKSGTTHDRTWCFWEMDNGPFEPIVLHRWPLLRFYQGNIQRRLEIAPYQYKMILAGDYYAFTDEAMSRAPRVERLYGHVNSIANQGEKVAVTVEGVTYTADWCINSLPGPAIDKSSVNYLDQHFRGWFIRTERPVFQPEEALLMDFRTPQADEFRFLYVLPTNRREALVEVAIFSNQHQPPEGYDDIIRAYLREHWPQLGDYSIVRTEMGNIPMTDHPFPMHDGRVVNVGMHGGDTRASSGYTFLYTHRRVARIIQHLEQHGTPLAPRPWAWRRHRGYDRLLLHVLQRQLRPGDQLFGQLFAKNPPQRVFRFLNAESSLWDELQLMSSLPAGVFLKALIRELQR